MTTEVGKAAARAIGSGRVPNAAVSVTATVVAQSAPAAFSAPATGSAITVSTNDAADLTTVGDGLEALRDECALYEIAITALIADVDALRTELVAMNLAAA